MKFARFVRIGLLAVLATAILLVVLSVTSLNPLRFRSNPDARPTTVAVATRAVTPEAAPAQEPTAASPTPALPPLAIPADASASFQLGVTLRRNGDYVRAATAFRAAISEHPDAALAREAQYRLGETLYLAGDFTNAVPALDAVVQERDDDGLAARAHYLLGDIYTQQQNYDAALAELRAYRGRTTALMGVIDREIGDVLLASGDSAAAIAQYQVAFGDPTFGDAQRVDVLKKIAEVYQARGEPARAAAQLEQAFDLAPDNATRAGVEYLWGQALEAAGESPAAITHWKHALAAYTTTPGAHLSVARLVELGVPGIDELQRGIANYSVGNYDLALQAFRRYIAAESEPGAEVLYYAGMAYQRLGNQAGALRNLDVLLTTYPADKRVADALYAKSISQIREGGIAAALVTLRQLHKQFPADARAAEGFWTAAQSYEGAGNYAQAAVTYGELATSFPASDRAPAALFYAGVSYYLVQDSDRARASWSAAVKNYPASTAADSAAYWLGKLSRAGGNEAAALQYFQQATRPPRSYYSWRAFDALNQPAPPPSYNLADYAMDDGPDARGELEQWIAKWSGQPATAQLPAAVLGDPYYRRGNEYAQLARALDARAQFQTLNERFKDNAPALYALALYYKDANFFSSSIDAAGRLAALSGRPETSQPRLLRQLVYPTYYADLIVPYAQQYGFDPAIFFGLVRQESGFNPMSYSSAQARGLTQVIPGTGTGIAQALNVTNFKQSDLFKPFVSVRFGAYYLGAVLDIFDGNAYYALLGYNGGPGNARKWIKNDLDLAVETVTLPESYLYVRTVIAQYRQYTDVYRAGTQ